MPKKKTENIQEPAEVQAPDFEYNEETLNELTEGKGDDDDE